MTQDRKWFDLAMKIAGSQTPKFGYRFAAVLVSRGEVISVGTNMDKTHPFAARYGRNPDATYWHAETHAIHNAYKAETAPKTFQKSTMYVARLKIRKEGSNRTLAPGLARPCKGCMHCMQVFEIPRVVYSLDDVNDYAVCDFA
jgi:tRNA(Arg) A34 adenosine deaminase TadA